MKHAFCILAHNSPLLLKSLLHSIDHPDCDIYIHIDKKCNIDKYKFTLQHSKLFYIENRHDIKWGGYSMVKAELSLFEYAYNNSYDYYHLLSGVDALIKPINYILFFFENNKGSEFLGSRIADKLHYYRVNHYHFQFNRPNFFTSLYTYIENYVQILLGISRINKNEVFYGNQWGSFTNSFIRLCLENKSWIKHHFEYTQCADEIYKQSLMHKYGFHLKDMGSIRLIDWKRGNPYIYRKSDFNLIIKSTKLFARKFSETDLDIIEMLNTYNSKCKINL